MPVVVDWPGTMIAANVGGAITPVVVSAYLLARYRLWVQAVVAVACIGTLVGADLLNLGRLRGLGAPVASIGGAGTFDGIFLTGVLAVLITGLSSGPDGTREYRARRG